MFRSLLRTIPSVSGNFTLSCRLNDIIKKSDKEYVAYINSAILLPLDNNIKLFRDININLQNAKYEYDVQRYWKLISDSFYKDTYLIHENIFDNYDGNNYNLKDNRDKTFEYGCSRISYNYTGYQFRFYAPIYINDVNDLPDSFNILIKNQKGQILKKIIIPLSEKINLNKLRIYLTKFINKLYKNIPAYWNFDDNKIVYKNVIDCKNGGLINFTSYNVIKNNSNQVVINDFDNSISLAYSSNNIIMSEIIPLSFIFNIEDFIKPEDLYYYQFNNFIISGAYVKNGIQQSFYDFDCNYHYKDITYKTFNVLLNNYEINEYNLFSNKQNNAYQEGTELRLYYENTLTHNYFKWKKFETDDYIINANAAYTSEYNRYGEFPILKNSINSIYAHIIKHNNIHNNLIIPLKEYTRYFGDKEINNYAYVMNNYYSNWFDIYPSEEDNINEDNINMYSWSKVYNGYTYNKGIYYFLQNDSIDYFNVFVNPILSQYNKDIEFSDWVFEYNKNINNVPINIKNSSSDMNYIASNKYLVPVSEDEISRKIEEYSNPETRDYNELNDKPYYIQNTYISEYIKYDDIQTLLSSYNNIDILNLFIKEYGYEKLNKITNSNIVENNKILFYTLLLNDREKYNNIYYSEYNSKVKKLLKTYLDQNNFDINLFSNEKFSFFYKSIFVCILKPEEIERKLLDEFSGDNMHSLLYRYKNIYDILIDNIKYCIYTLCNDGNDWHQLKNKDNEIIKTYSDEEYFAYLGGMASEDKNSILLNHTDKVINTIKYIFDNDIRITVDNIFENVFDDIDISNYDKNEIQKTLEYINFLFHYQQIIDNLINNENSNNIIPKYYYVPYYNDNNIYIDYDFFQQVGYKNQSYDNLYIDSYNLENHLLNYIDESVVNEIIDNSNNIKYKFVNIFNKEILKGYIDELYNDEVHVKRSDFNFIDNLYHCISFFDNNFNITYKVIKLKDYINLIIHNTINKHNEYHDGNSNIIDVVDNDNLLYILNNFTTFENNECIINIPFEKYLYTDYDKKFNEAWELYISENISDDPENTFKTRIDKFDEDFRTFIYDFNLYHDNKSLYTKDGEIIKTSKEYILEYNTFKNKFEKSYFINFIEEKMQDIPVSISTIKCNLFYKKKLYKLTPEIHDLCLSNNIPLNIYKTFNKIIPNQLVNRNNIELYNKSNFTENELGYNETISINDSGEFNLVYLLSRSIFNTSDTILNQQILLKNIHLYNDVYVYENEKHSFKQVYFEEYMSSYINHYTLYEESNINKIDLQLNKDDDNKIHVFNYNGKKYGYIVINYNFDCSSNSFNIYTADNNDNIEIEYVNGLKFNNTLVKSMFPYLYPYMKSDIMLSIFSDIKDYIVLPNNITLFIDKQVVYYYEDDASENINYTKLSKSLNSSKVYINRYFGNMCPMLIKVDNLLYNQYAKLFKLNTTTLAKLIPNHNNLIKENINIYKYKPITYISNILYKYNETSEIQNSYYDFIVDTDSQIEYKHFNDNNLFILPNRISFTHTDIPYIECSKKDQYANEDTCFKYFKNYIKSKYYLKLDENQLLFLFKKYTILKYEENIIKYNIKINKKYCTITYILTLN